jgi:signal transduction histidine kinase
MDVVVERDRLMRAAALRVDISRRAFRYAIPYGLSLCSLGLAAFLPGYERVFGNTTPAAALLVSGACAASVLVSTLAFRVFGDESRAYAAAEGLEVLCLTGAGPAFALMSNHASPIFVLIYPIGPVFWASMKPGLWPRYAWIALGPLVSVAALSVQRAPAQAFAWFAVGVVANLAAMRVARSQRRNFLIEAERNAAEEQLAERRSEARRRELARSVEKALGEELRSLACELERHTCTQPEADYARAIAKNIELVWSTEPACTAASLGQRIEQKCAPLCSNVLYEQAIRLPAERRYDSSATTTLLRIAQELVRNAVLHSAATRVSLELMSDGDETTLRVRDDGKGLSTEMFERSQGGIENARRRLNELGGSLSLVAVPRGTEVIARIPAH